MTAVGFELRLIAARSAHPLPSALRLYGQGTFVFMLLVDFVEDIIRGCKGLLEAGMQSRCSWATAAPPLFWLGSFWLWGWGGCRSWLHFSLADFGEAANFRLLVSRPPFRVIKYGRS